jgi:hypothetical protein
MADKRAGGILFSSFVGGALVTAAVFAPRAWEPVPEPFFGIEDPPAVAVPLRDATAPPVPGGANLDAMAVALRERAQAAGRPERLAMNEAAPDVMAEATRQSPPANPSAAAAASNASGQAIPVSPESLKSLVTRVQTRRSPEDSAAAPARIEPLPAVDSLGMAPLPGEEWTDPDRVNWSDAPASDRPSDGRSPSLPRQADDTVGGRLLERLRNQEAPGTRPGERLRSRSRRDDNPAQADRIARAADASSPGSVEAGTWPEPIRLVSQLDAISKAALGEAPPPSDAREWASTTLGMVRSVIATSGPRDAAAAAALLALGEAVHAGMTVADAIPEPTASSQVRRAALAVSRRVAVWRAAAGWLTADANLSGSATTASRDPLTVARTEAEVVRLLAALEQFENRPDTVAAANARDCLRAIAAAADGGGESLCRAVTDHYLAPNVRVAVHQEFLGKFLPEKRVTTGPVDEVIAGRAVRGKRTVTRTTTVTFVPDVDEIAFNLEVHGDISSRSVTDAGPVSLVSRGNSSFVVQKLVKLSAQGLLFGPATGVGANRSQLDGMQTSFDAVPVMRSLVRQIAKSQHDESLPDINREVVDKIVATACRETDAQAEPQFAELAERIRARVWTPLVALGLDPTPVALETSSSMATVRLRLAAGQQLAAHTPRPRAPADAWLSMQVHDSSLNNALERLDIGGRTLALEDLIRQLCIRLGLEPKIPDDLPEGVQVTFSRSQPLRVDCSDRLVHVHVAIDALESGRRNWYDLVAHVAYRPTVSGSQVYLEREGPVQISGHGHQGRMELGLRTIFGKIFPKERPIAVLPARVAANPRLASMQAVQAVSSDGWFALALAPREPATTSASPKPAAPEARRKSLLR